MKTQTLEIIDKELKNCDCLIKPKIENFRKDLKDEKCRCSDKAVAGLIRKMEGGSENTSHFM